MRDDTKPLFALGRLVATPGALALLQDAGQEYTHLIHRHRRGDWGNIDPGDKGMNEDAVKNGDRILSVYKLTSGTVWVITEADRSSTTILLPSEY
jgi:hypothetical protein